MKLLIRTWILTCLLTFLGGVSSVHGVVISDSENVSMELGLRFSGLFSIIQVKQPARDLHADDDKSRDIFFNINQARLRIRTSFYNARLSLQTDIKRQQNSSTYIRLLDALFVYEFHPLFNLYAGIHLPPSHRDSVTSSLTSLTIERPLISTKPLTWFNQGISAYFNDQHNLQGTYFQNVFTVRVPLSRYEERDIGITLHGRRSLSSNVHMKYYSGFYDGVKTQDQKEPQFLRTTQRLQINFFDPEPNYFSQATYLAQMKTLALGASFDYQNTITMISPIEQNTPYLFYSIDAFGERPFRRHYALNVEAAYMRLSLSEKAPTKEGQGGYFQIGFLFRQVQAWMSYEKWISVSQDFGSFDAARAGTSYFYKGHDFKISLGWEFIRATEFSSYTYHNTFIAQIKLNI